MQSCVQNAVIYCHLFIVQKYIVQNNLSLPDSQQNKDNIMKQLVPVHQFD